MSKKIRGVRGLALAAAMLTAAGCSQLGTVGDVLGGVLNPGGGGGNAQGSEVYGEVRGVDAQRQIIQIETQNGQVGNVYFDQNTRVVYQQREYPVTALERGDAVGMRLQQDQRGNVYTSYIVVTQSVQERTGMGGGSGGYENSGFRTLEGRVGWVDTSRGEFELRTNQGNAVVALRYNSGAYEVDRFRRLRQGDRVRIEGRVTSQNRIELERFL